MSKGPIMFNKARGKLGNMVLSVQRGQQIARAYNETNASKAEGASYAQREHRVRLNNLIAFYRILLEFFQKAFQFKLRNVSDYNAFVATNLNINPVFLTRAQYENGACVLAPYIIARGNLIPIGVAFTNGNYLANIPLGGDGSAITSATTIATFTRNLIAGGGDYRNGDMLTFCIFKQVVNSLVVGDTTVDIPAVIPKYYQLVLDTRNTAPLPSDVFALLQGAEFGSENIPLSTDANAVAITLTRISGQTLQVSTTTITMGAAQALPAYTSPDALEAACISYGYAGRVLLEPNAQTASDTTIARIETIKVGSIDLANGGVYDVGKTLYITGSNLTRDNIKLYQIVEGRRVEWTPISATATQIAYNLNDDGTMVLYINGEQVYSWTMQGTSMKVLQSIQFNGRSQYSPMQGITVNAGSVQSGKVSIIYTEGVPESAEVSVFGASLVSSSWSVNEETKVGTMDFQVRVGDIGALTIAVDGVVAISGTIFEMTSGNYQNDF